MEFYVGLHHPFHARYFDRACISINTLRARRSGFVANDWILDSGAFTELARYGEYREAPEKYAEQINRWKHNGKMLAAVSQDYMCEPFILRKTGLSIESHQRLTIERYRSLRELTDAYVLPVLQGYDPSDYVAHIAKYGDLLPLGAWTGVGSICKRNTNVESVAFVLSAIKLSRPDLRLHGFGLKSTALADSYIRSLLYSADSMAWSFAARRQGRNQNSWREAKLFADRFIRSSTNG